MENSRKADKRDTSEKVKKEHIDQAFIHFSQACVENAGKFPLTL